MKYISYATDIPHNSRGNEQVNSLSKQYTVMQSIKEDLKEKVKAIVYEKAKEEARSFIRGKINKIKNKIRSFFGLGESRKEKLNRLAKFYTDKKDAGHQNLVTGVIELYTLTYMQSMAELMSHSMRDQPEKEHLAKVDQ